MSVQMLTIFREYYRDHVLLNLEQKSNYRALLLYMRYQVSRRRYKRKHSRTREISAAHFIEYSILVYKRYFEIRTSTPENGRMPVQPHLTYYSTYFISHQCYTSSPPRAVALKKNSSARRPDPATNRFKKANESSLDVYPCVSILRDPVMAIVPTCYYPSSTSSPNTPYHSKCRKSSCCADTNICPSNSLKRRQLLRWEIARPEVSSVPLRWMVMINLLFSKMKSIHGSLLVTTQRYVSNIDINDQAAVQYVVPAAES